MDKDGEGNPGTDTAKTDCQLGVILGNGTVFQLQF